MYLNKWEERMDFKENTLYVSDCLELLRYWYHKLRLSKIIDLIYIDPPFNSKRDYNIIIQPHDIQLQEKAFEDTWTLVNYSDCLEEIKAMGYNNVFWFIEGLKSSNLNSGHISYLANMAIRVIYMKEMLKDTGNFCYHCDPTMSHYIKIMLDFIFGIGNFRNEIVWCYKTGGVSKEYFPRKHDIIFFYTKSDKYTFNPQKELKTSNEMKRALEIHPEEFFDDNDGKGIYTWYYRPGHKKYPDGLKQYLEAYIRDYWLIPALSNTDKERLGYPTQKPEELLSRIILALSNPGDLVADFFMGGGTTLAVAKKNNRKFIGADINLRAVQWTSNRLNKISIHPAHSLSGIPASSKELQIYLQNFTPSKGGFTLEDLVIKAYLTNTVSSYGFEVIGQEKNNVGYDGEFIWTFDGKARRGLIQVTASHNFQHFSSFCNVMSQINADMGVYITFKQNITPNIKIYSSNSRKIGPFNSVQILTLEDLIDNNKLFDVPFDYLKV